MKHKHADVLIAIAEGKEVEWETRDGKWIEMTPGMNPLTHPEYPWKIKPQPEAEWKQKLRQAARGGATIQTLDRTPGAVWRDSNIMQYPDTYNFGDAPESQYRIVPKTVTRWLWAVATSNNDWWQHNDFMNDEEARNILKNRQYVKLEYTRTEFPE